MLGGSWSGPKDLAKDAEVYDPTRGVWTSLLGIQAATILTDDPEDAQEGRNYRADNYGMFHAWSGATGASPPRTIVKVFFCTTLIYSYFHPQKHKCSGKCRFDQ